MVSRTSNHSPALMTALIQRGTCDVIDVVLSLLHAVDILLPETGSYFRSCVRTAALLGSVFLHTASMSHKPQASGDSDLRCSVSTLTTSGSVNFNLDRTRSEALAPDSSPRVRLICSSPDLEVW